jgi:hypothetical protein
LLSRTYDVTNAQGAQPAADFNWPASCWSAGRLLTNICAIAHSWRAVTATGDGAAAGSAPRVQLASAPKIAAKTQASASLKAIAMMGSV